MSEHAAGRQQAGFFVEHRTQEHIGAYKPLHQDVGLSVAYELHSEAGGLCGVGGCHMAHMSAQRRPQGLVGGGEGRAYEYGFGKAAFHGPCHGCEGGMVGAPHHSNAPSPAL